MIILTMFLAFFLAFQAGTLYTAIKVDYIEGRKPDWKLYFFCVANSLISIYMIISTYGMGLKHDL